MKNTFIFLLIFPWLALTQEAENHWEGYFSYYNITDLHESESKIYAAAENAYFVYDISTGTKEKITALQGLSGDPISKIYHSETHEAACIGYQNGLLQIVMDNNQHIFTVVDIRDKISISPNLKRINHFYEHEDILYIATDFGIAEYDLENLEFKDSFFIGNNGSQIQVNQIAIADGKIYAATTIQGIKTALINNQNLVDFQNWQTEYTGNWKGVLAFANSIFGWRSNNTIYTLDQGITSVFQNIGSPIRGFNVSGNQMMITASDQVLAYNSNLTLKAFFDDIPDEDFNFDTAVSSNGQYFLGHTRLGVLMFNANSSTNYSKISPDGPLFNKIFSLTSSPTSLWVSFGEYDQFYNPYSSGLNERGLSHLTPEGWVNIDVEDLNNAAVLSHITVDPQNPNRIFVSSFFDGLLEIENNQLIHQFDASNSNIEGVPSNINDNRIGSSAFDNRGDLYFSNSLTPNHIKRLNSDGSFFTPNTSEGVSNPETVHSAKLVVDNNNNVYLGTLTEGIIAYSSDTDSARAITSNVAGADFPDTFNLTPHITALAVDQNNRLWIGTQAGIRVMSNPSSIFEETPVANISPIIIEDVDGLPQELLFEQYITDIAVDGANNKWIATADSGVFQVSSSGREVLNFFSEENSPLPTNSIKAVSINDATGEVFFGTTNGLLSYSSFITSENENLENLRAFPNPVRPNYNGLVTIDGLTDGANVKITDVTGNLVFEEFSKGGTIQWDTRAFGKHKVASGVYFIITTAQDQQDTKVGKIMIIR